MVRHSMENTEAKEEQSAFKSPPDCSLLVDAHVFQVDVYRFGDFMGSNSFRRLSFELSEKRFQHFRPQEFEMVVVERPCT